MIIISSISMIILLFSPSSPSFTVENDIDIDPRAVLDQSKGKKEKKSEKPGDQGVSEEVQTRTTTQKKTGKKKKTAD